MPALVLDGSVAVAWFVPGEESEPVMSVLDHAIAEGAVVPELWKIEVGNALLMAERRGRISVAGRARAMTALNHLQIEVDDQTFARAWDATLSLAERFRLTLYDAVYLELANRVGLPLASLDRELRKAADALGVSLLPRES